jgi:hypothetical protein
MTDIKIDKNVPIPETSGAGALYPFAEMEVGDSFYVEGKTTAQLQNSASHWRKRKGWKFRTRTEDKGARIWRVE